MVTKLKFKNYITSCSKNLRNQRTLRCKKNSLQVSYNSAKLVDDDFKTRRKTINAEFIQTRALSQLSFVPFRPYTTSFLELVLSLTPVSKSKRTPETSLDLTSSAAHTCFVLWTVNFLSVRTFDTVEIGKK